MTPEETEIACKIMHDAYELAAVKHKWATQERSRVPWEQVPEENKATMRAAVTAVAPYIQGLVRNS